MKYVVLTFDDGRSDNYVVAKAIMDQYHLKGTVYITTGFIDGSWTGKDALKSPTRPLKKNEICELYQDGWEIGVHGDTHKTEVSDMRIAVNKLKLWGIKNVLWGISLPNSIVDENEIANILESDLGSEISYIRKGRNCDTKKLINKLLYGIYSVFGVHWAYRLFNKKNSVKLNEIDRYHIPSVVIKSKDEPEMIVNYINCLPDESLVVLMLHSILSSHRSCRKQDPWSWEDKKFAILCEKIQELVNAEKLLSVPMINIISGSGYEKRKQQSYCLEH